MVDAMARYSGFGFGFFLFLLIGDRRIHRCLNLNVHKSAPFLVALSWQGPHLVDILALGCYDGGGCHVDEKFLPSFRKWIGGTCSYCYRFCVEDLNA